MPHDPANLEFTPDQMLAMGRAVVARSVAHLATVGTQPICGDVDAAELCRSMRESVPEAGSELEPLLDPLFDDLDPALVHGARAGLPRLHSGRRRSIPRRSPTSSPTRPTATPASGRRRRRWCSSRPTRSTGCATGWAFPRARRGLFTTGGSMATFNAIVCARERHLGADIRRGVLYTSDQAHHSRAEVGEARRHHARSRAAIPVDADFRMRRGRALEAPSRAIARRGCARSSSSSSAGTTNTGAVDPLDAIADLCARERAVAPRRRRVRRVLPRVPGAAAAARRACRAPTR